jgi:hypothetical protein
MSFATDKACALDKIRAFNCDYVQWVDDNLNAYADIIPVFLTHVTKLQCFPDYTYSLFDCFDGTALLAEGIYYNSTETTLTDPALIVKTTATDITITISSGSIINDFVIFGASTVDSVIIDGGGTLNCLSVTAGAVLKLLSTMDDSRIRLVRVTGCRTFISKLDAADSSSIIDSFYVFGGGTFGGYRCISLGTPCTDEVISLDTDKITSNSITLTWDNAASTINTIVYYRINNGFTWYIAGANPNGDGVSGSYTGDAVGFIFRGLQADTYYDFRVVNVCSNGNTSPGTIKTEKTTTV